MRLFVHSISFKILWEKKKTKLEDVSLSHKTVYMHMPFFCIFLYKAAISCVFWINWLSQVNIIKFLFNCLSSIFFFPDWKNLQLWACLLGYRLRQCSVVRSQLTQLVWITTQQDTVILINRKHWLEDWLGSVFYERLYLQLNYNHVFHNQLNVNPHSQAGEKVWGKSLSELRSPLVVLINTAVKKSSPSSMRHQCNEACSAHQFQCIFLSGKQNLAIVRQTDFEQTNKYQTIE